MNNKKMFELFLDYEKGYLKTSTLYIHELMIQHLINALSILKIDHVKKINDALLVSIIKTLRINDRSNSYINRHISILINAMIYHQIKINFNFKKLKYVDHSFERLYEDDLKKIFYVLYHHKATVNMNSYRTLLCLLLDSGCRISEALSIHIDHIYFEYPYRILLENTKTNKKRIVPFSDFSKKEIIDLINLKHDRDLLFYNFLKDRPLNKHDVKLFYRRLEEWTNIKRIHSHMFRKTFASMLLENGVPIESLQVLLGHSRITTTMIYTRFHNTRAIEQYNKYQDWRIKKED